MFENDEDEFLEHYGVKGMKWGVRRARPDGVSARTSREAKRDATEFAKAKMYYGEGAGTRRKLIKAKVETKAKKDPTYKKAFDHHLEGQDMGKRAAQARSKRRRTDAKNTAGKTARGVHRLATGGFGSTTATATVLFGGYNVLKQTGYDRVVRRAAKTAFTEAARSPYVKQGINILRDMNR